MTTMPLDMTLSGPDPRAIVEACIQRGLAPTGKPERVAIDDERVAVTDDWLVPGLTRAKRILFAGYPGYPHQITIYKEGLAVIGLPRFELEPRGLAEKLAPVPFELASFSTVHNAWIDGSLGEVYDAPSFGDWHSPLGWGCVFRGAGHERLVSRRWLEFGPWRLLHAAPDVSLIQFHDLDADAATALEQARPGQARMVGDSGGFIQTGFYFSQKLRGIYVPGEKKMKVVVHGRTVSQLEMLEWCAARRYQSFGPKEPVDTIAFVFPEERAAEQHLEELWLRELECWTIREGEEVRLDATYVPTRSAPAWVRNAR